MFISPGEGLSDSSGRLPDWFYCALNELAFARVLHRREDLPLFSMTGAQSVVSRAGGPFSDFQHLRIQDSMSVFSFSEDSTAASINDTLNHNDACKRLKNNWPVMPEEQQDPLGCVPGASGHMRDPRAQAGTHSEDRRPRPFPLDFGGIS